MDGLFIGIAAIAGACAYLVGYAFIAPRESFARTPGGGAVAGACVLVALLGPPSAAALAGGGPWWFRPTWIGAEAVGLLAGMRVWRMRPGLLGRRGLAFDESPASRAAVGMQLADSLDAALDVLARERVGVRDLERLTPALKHVAARFWHQMPERHGDLYALVASHVEPKVAAIVTGVLLDGAGRRR